MTLPRWLLLFCLAAMTASLSAQTLENYQQQKKVEKAEPNRFLKGESLEKPDQLSRYYRRAFSDQQSFRSFSFQGKKDGDASLGQNQTSGMATLEGPVDPGQYVVGPMDVLSINLWGDMPSVFQAVVTPEGSVLIPSVGEVSVRNLTLTEAKAIIIREVQKQYSRATVTVTLLAPRSFMVHVSGMVSAPGAYEASAVDRAERVIAMANLTGSSTTDKGKDQYEEDAERNISFENAGTPPKPEMSLRNIRIQRGGKTLRVDLLRLYATGDLHANPFLHDGDVIVVAPEILDNNTVSISGAVRLPGKFEFVQGDSLGLMIRIAQGFKEHAVIDSIEILRLPTDGGPLQRILVDGRRLAEGQDLALQANDRVLVQERKPEVHSASIVIRGEVQRPGSYPVTASNTTVTQVLMMAGGFTGTAAPSEVMILRADPNREIDPMKSVPDFQRLAELRLSDMNKEEREYYTLEAAIKRNIVAFDATSLFVNGNADADVTLRDGDEIMVPSTQNTVYVFGQVARPGHVTHVPGMEASYYLSRAGKVSDNAVTGDIKVIKAGSKNWLDPEDTTIDPGDALWVPREPDRDFLFYFTAIRDFLQVSVAIATVYLLIQQIQN